MGWISYPFELQSYLEAARVGMGILMEISNTMNSSGQEITEERLEQKKKK